MQSKGSAVKFEQSRGTGFKECGIIGQTNLLRVLLYDDIRNVNNNKTFSG